MCAWNFFEGKAPPSVRYNRLAMASVALSVPAARRAKGGEGRYPDAGAVKAASIGTGSLAAIAELMSWFICLFPDAKARLYGGIQMDSMIPLGFNTSCFKNLNYAARGRLGTQGQSPWLPQRSFLRVLADLRLCLL